MEKTPEQIYDGVEARWGEAKAQTKKRRRKHLNDALSLAAPLLAFGYWAFRSRIDLVAMAAGMAYFSFAWSELTKRWDLEDRVAELEKMAAHGPRPSSDARIPARSGFGGTSHSNLHD